VVTHQLQVERRLAKARRPKTDVLLLDHGTNVDKCIYGGVQWPMYLCLPVQVWECDKCLDDGV